MKLGLAHELLDDGMVFFVIGHDDAVGGVVGEARLKSTAQRRAVARVILHKGIWRVHIFVLSGSVLPIHFQFMRRNMLCYSALRLLLQS